MAPAEHFPSIDLGGVPFDRLHFKRPASQALLNHCHMLCKAEGVPFCSKAICDLIEYYQHDIRRIFSALQVWGPRNKVSGEKLKPRKGSLTGVCGGRGTIHAWWRALWD